MTAKASTAERPQGRDAGTLCNLLLVTGDRRLHGRLARILGQAGGFSLHVTANPVQIERACHVRCFDGLLLDPDSIDVAAARQALLAARSLPVLALHYPGIELPEAVHEAMTLALVIDADLETAIVPAIQQSRVRFAARAEIRRLENAARDARSLLDTVFAMGRQGMVILDEEGRILKADRGLAEMVATPREALLGRNFRDLVTADLVPAVDIALSQTLERREACQMALKIRSAGRAVAARLRLRTLALAAGGLRQVIMLTAEPPGSAAAREARERNAILQRLSEQRGTLPIGRFELLGQAGSLEREAFDDAIDRLTDEDLREAEVGSRTEDGAFVLVMGGVDDQHARARVDEIGARIGIDMDAAASRRGEGACAAIPAGLRARCHRVEFSSRAELEEADDLALFAARRLADQMRARLSNPQAIVRSLYLEARSRAVPVMTIKGEPGGMIATGFDARSEERLADLEDLGVHDTQWLHEADLFQLNLGAAMLAEQAAAEPLRAIVPVSWASLSDKRLWSRWSELCHTLPRGLRGDMVFEIMAVPRGTYPPKIVQALARLATFSPLNALALDGVRFDPIDIASMRLRLVTISHGTLRGDLAAQPETIRQLLARCRRARVRVLLRRCPSPRPGIANIDLVCPV